MIQLTPQMRLLLAVEPVDFRNYSELRPKRSGISGDLSRLARYRSE